MLRIGICDDEASVLESFKRYVEAWSIQEKIAVSVFGFFTAEQLLFSFAEETYDILLLDIQLPGLNGVSLAKKIRERDERVQIVFITGVGDYISEGYEVSALHYLLKPIDKERLGGVLSRAQKNLHAAEKTLLWKTDGEIQIIPLREVLYLEVKGHYVTVCTESEKYTRKANLTTLLESLDNRFFRCHRSYVVNLHRILKVMRNEVVLSNGEVLPLSRNQYDAIHQQIIRLYPEVE